jgi:hypothetical protein
MENLHAQKLHARKYLHGRKFFESDFCEFLDDLHACNFGLQKTTYLSHFWALLAHMQAPLIDMKKYILYKKISACMCASF